MVRISDAELEVLKVIWDKGEVSSTEIIKELKDYPWNPNTIRTLIKRLENKGAIEISRKNGKAFMYKSTIDEEKYKNDMTLELLKKFYNNSIIDFILDICDVDDIVTPNEMKNILDDITEKINKNGDVKKI